MERCNTYDIHHLKKIVLLHQFSTCRCRSFSKIKGVCPATLLKKPCMTKLWCITTKICHGILAHGVHVEGRCKNDWCIAAI